MSCPPSAVRARARARLVIPVCVSPLLQVWRSAAAQSRARRSAVLQSVVPVSISWLLSQWRGGYLSHVPVVLYPDRYPYAGAAPFTLPVKAMVTTFGLLGKSLRESNPWAHLDCEVPLER